MMDEFKSIVRVEYIHGVKNLGWDRFDGKLLQRDYYEHIIHDEDECQCISEYIFIIRQNGKTINFIMRRGVPLWSPFFGMD